MDRYDVEKRGRYEANYNAGWVETQEDHVVLKGTRAEVDLIIKGLKLLNLESERNHILGVTSSLGEKASSSYYRPQYARLSELLSSIEEPKLVAEADVAYTELEA